MRTPACRRRPGRRGFSILELIIAVALTMVIALVIFQIYKVAIDSYVDIRGSIHNLEAYRNAVDKIEIELSGIVAKACYLPNNRDVGDPKGSGFKSIDDGIFQIRFLHHQLGFYTSTNPARIDKVIYYHNRAEDDDKLNNNIDDDGDDWPSDPLGEFTDDNGYLMCWRRDDHQLSYDEYSAAITDPTATHTDGTPDPVVTAQPFFNPYLNETAVTPETFGPQEGTPQTAGTPDYGEILAKSVKMVTFSYVWTKKGPGGKGIDPQFQYAPCWPDKAYDAMTGLQNDWNVPGRVVSDLTGYQYGAQYTVDLSGANKAVDHRKGMSYMTLPIAVQINFEFLRNGNPEFMNKTIYIYRSDWNSYLTKATP
ncbi:MAG: PulJ/GspJ family protein [Planctomycetota bacterium]